MCCIDEDNSLWYSPNAGFSPAGGGSGGAVKNLKKKDHHHPSKDPRIHPGVQRDFVRILSGVKDACLEMKSGKERSLFVVTLPPEIPKEVCGRTVKYGSQLLKLGLSVEEDSRAENSMALSISSVETVSNQIAQISSVNHTVGGVFNVVLGFKRGISERIKRKYEESPNKRSPQYLGFNTVIRILCFDKPLKRFYL